MSEAPCIVGVEIDPTFCHIQQQMVTKYGMKDRIQVLQEDIYKYFFLLLLLK